EPDDGGNALVRQAEDDAFARALAAAQIDQPDMGEAVEERVERGRHDLAALLSGEEKGSFALQPLAPVDRVPGIVDHVPRLLLTQLGVDVGAERRSSEVAGSDRGHLHRAFCLAPAIARAEVEFPDLVALVREMRQRAQYSVAESALYVGLYDETAQRPLLA